MWACNINSHLIRSLVSTINIMVWCTAQNGMIRAVHIGAITDWNVDCPVLGDIAVEGTYRVIHPSYQAKWSKFNRDHIELRGHIEWLPPPTPAVPKNPFSPYFWASFFGIVGTFRHTVCQYIGTNRYVLDRPKTSTTNRHEIAVLDKYCIKIPNQILWIYYNLPT